MALTYKVWADLSHSEQVVDRLTDGVKLLTPATKARRILNWITEGGYADLDTTDDVTKPRLLWSAVDTNGDPITVYIDNIPTVATDLPFIVSSSAPENPFFTYNIPRIIGLTYTVSVKFIMPGVPDRAATASWTVVTASV